MNRERFLELIETHNVKFTPAQNKFVDFIRRGCSYTVQNQHHLSGGTAVWINEYGNEEYAGRFFVLIGNVSHRFKKATGEDSEFHKWLKVN